MELFNLIAQTASSETHPYWVSLITGSGGALIVLMMWVRTLSTTLKKKDDELMEISKRSIECITQILERKNQEKDWKERLDSLLNEIHSCLKERRKSGE